MDKDIEVFIKSYFDERGLSRNHDMVKYISFADDQKTSDALLEEMKSGRKKATYRLKKWHDLNLTKLPKVDMVMIFADFYGFPAAISRVRKVEFIEVRDFTHEMAIRIGLGATDYKHWLKKCHETIAYDCANIEIEFTPQTEVSLVWFELLFPTNNKL